jgi:hypothetical protein
MRSSVDRCYAVHMLVYAEITSNVKVGICFGVVDRSGIDLGRSRNSHVNFFLILVTAVSRFSLMHFKVGPRRNLTLTADRRRRTPLQVDMRQLRHKVRAVMQNSQKGSEYFVLLLVYTVFLKYSCIGHTIVRNS